MEIQSPLHNQVKQLPGLFMGKVILGHLTSPAGVNQMVETYPIDLLRLYQIKDSRDIVIVTTGNGEALDHPLTHGHQITYPSKSGGKSPFLSPEAVIIFADSIQANSHVAETAFLYLLGELFRYQSAVGGKDGPDTKGGCLG